MKVVARRKTITQVAIFSVLTLLLAWISPSLGGSPSSPGVGFILWGTAPLLVSLLIRLVTRDWADLGWKPAFAKNLWWYVVSLLAYPAVMLLALVLGSLISVSSLTGFAWDAYLPITLTALPIFLVFALFEEVGWRGYLAPKLASLGINVYVAAAIVGLVWTLWHLPFLSELSWVYSSEPMVSFVPRYFLLLFAFSLFYGEIRNITGTFWPAVLLHAASNAFGHPLADYVDVVAGKEYLGSISTGLFVLVGMAFLGIVLKRWRDTRSNLVSV